MEQMHKRFSTEQVKTLLEGFCQGTLDRAAIEEILGIGRSRFFAMLSEYRHDPARFSLTYERKTPARLPTSAEMEIEEQLLLERALVEDRSLPISTYNYSAIRDRLLERGVRVSLPTIIDRAKRLECYKPHLKKKVHDREVITTAIGALIQHDASHHRWSPYAKIGGS